MAKQLNIDMRFNADTSQARKAIEDLNNSLSKLAYGSMPQNAGIDPAKFEAAAKSARELTYHLNQAFNTKTGNLDLSKLDASLKSSKTSLGDLTKNFADAGQAGQQAFVALAQSIAAADQPVLGVNRHLATLWTTLKNVARFQISSSIIHGLMGGLQSAYGYAKDLNQSLNNIRIVTGDSTEKMAQFAREANNAAKALSSTTLDYTNASLIYYQQGLDDQAVKARTDVTIKLANVSRQSAEEVSNQMTAIWNNFEDGAHTMEYFADVITALGATTAASSEEIATGLEKFAPVAGTIGLSYEKATAALAAIVANTRQSADTVGTGLRTIFSRFEGLTLGETLEDGVDLNKYSKAMQTIGVNILNANGELRTMDDILDDVAAHWDQLNETQKTAFATTVGGVRQYTNLIALFDNWNDVQKNMATALGSEGTLQKQADIYAESWEAAQKRVRTSLQGLWDTLINDKGIIKLNNVIASVITGIDKFIQNFGGVKNIIISALSMVAVLMANKVQPIIDNLISNLKILFGQSKSVYEEMLKTTTTLINGEINKKDNTGNSIYSLSQQTELSNSQKLLTIKTKLSAEESKLSATEKMRAQLAIQGIELQLDTIKKQTLELEKQQKVVQQLTEAENKRASQAKEDLKKLQQEQISAQRAVTIYEGNQRGQGNLIRSATSTSMLSQDRQTKFTTELGMSQQEIDDLSKHLDTVGNKIKTQIIEQLIQAKHESTAIGGALKSIFQNKNGTINDAFKLPDNLPKEKELEVIRQYQQRIAEIGKSFGKVITDSAAFKELISKKEVKSVEDYNRRLENFVKSLTKVRVLSKDKINVLKSLGVDEKVINNYQNALERLNKAKAAVTAATNKEKKAQDQANSELEEAQKEVDKLKTQIEGLTRSVDQAIGQTSFKHWTTGIEALMSMAGAAGSAMMALNSLNGIIDAFDNKKPLEGITQGITAFAFMLPGLINAWKGLRTVQDWATTSLMTHNAVLAVTQGLEDEVALKQALKILGIEDETVATEILTKAKTANTAEEYHSIIADELAARNIPKKTAALLAENFAFNTNTTVTSTNTKVTLANVAAKILSSNVTKLLGVALMAGIFIWQRIQKAQEKARQSTLDYADATQKAVDKQKSEAESNKETIKSYEDARKAWEDGTGSKEDMVTAAQEAIKAYDLEREAVDLAANSYENLIKRLREAARAQDENLLNSQRRAYVANQLALAVAMDTSDNANVTDLGNGKISYKFKGTDTNNYINLAIQSLDAAGELDKIKIDPNNKLIGKAEDIYAALEKITNKADDLAKASNFDLGEYSTAYKNTILLLNEVSDKYELITGNIQSLQTLSISSELNLIKQEDLDNFDEYSRKVDQIIKKLKEFAWFEGLTEDEIRDLVNQVFGDEEQFQDYSNVDTKITNIAERTGIDVDEVTKWYNGLDDDQKAVFLQLDISKYDKGKITDDLNKQIDYLQALANKNEVQIKINAAQEGQAMAQAGKTTIEEWQDWAEKNLTEDFYEKYGSLTNFLFLKDEDKRKALNSWEDFLNSTYKIQSEAIEGMSSFLRQRLKTIDSIIQDTEYTANTDLVGMFKNIASSSNVGMKDLVAVTHGVQYNNENIFTRRYNTEEDKYLAYYTAVREILQFIKDPSEFYSTAAVLGLNVLDTDPEELSAYFADQKNPFYDLINSAFKAEKAGNELMELKNERTKIEDLLEKTLNTSLDLATPEQKEWAIEFSNRATALGIDIDTIRAYADNLRNLGVITQDANESYDDFIKRSLSLATKQIQLERGFETLNSEFDNFYALLSSGEKTQKFSESLDKMRQGLSDLIGGFDETKIDIKIFDEQWFENNQENIEKALQNNDWGDLRKSIANKILKNGNLFENINDETIKNSLRNNLQAVIDSVNFDDLKIGIGVDNTNALENLDKLYWKSEEYRDAINAVLQGIGYNPTITWKTVELSASEDAVTEANGITTLQTADGQTIQITSEQYAARQSSGGTTISYPVLNAEATAFAGSNSPSSNGGGGGSKSTKKAAKPDRGTRYHTIKAQQSDNDRATQAAADRAERSVGKTRIDNLQEQIKLQQEAVKLQKQLLDENAQWLKIDRDEMLRQGATLGIKFEFDENGVITNYQAIEDELLRMENDLIEKYNAGALDDDSFDEEKEKIDELKEAIEGYEESQDMAEEEAQNLIDQLNEMQDLILNLTQTKVELNITLKDDELEYLDYQLSKLEDDAYAAAEAIALIGGKTSNQLDRANIYEQGIMEILAQHGINSIEELAGYSAEELSTLGFTSKEQEQLREWRSNLLEINQELIQMRKDVIDKLTESFESMNDEIREQQDLFEHYDTVLEHYRNIVDLNGSALGDQGKELLKTLDQAALANNKNQLRSAKIAYDTAIANQTSVLEAYNSLTTDEQRQAYKPILDAANEAAREAQEEWLQIWEDNLQRAAEILEREAENATDAYLKPLDYFNDVYGRQKELDDIYQPEFERLHNLSKLSRELNSMIDDTDSIKGKKNLIALQERINKLMEAGNKLSDYDIEALEKEIALEKARIALEDAQNAKSQVRLQRDNEGNWGYVYTADEKAVAEAEQAYEDALYEYQKLNDDYINSLQDQLLDLRQTMGEQLKEVWADTTLTDAEKEQRSKELTDYYNSMAEILRSQAENALNAQAGTLELYKDKYGEFATELTDTFNETLIGRMFNNEMSMDEYFRESADAIGNLVSQLRVADENWRINNENIDAVAGVPLNEVLDHVTSAMVDIGTQSNQTTQAIEVLSETLTEQFNQAIQAAMNFEEQQAAKIDEQIQKTEQWVEVLNALNIMLHAVGSEDTEFNTQFAAWQAARMQYSRGEISNNEWNNINSDMQDLLASRGPVSLDFDNYPKILTDTDKFNLFTEKDQTININPDADKLLEITDILRKIDSQVKLQQYDSVLASMVNPLSGELVVDQNVHITAEFPNVTDHNEIEEALNNLVMRASQYINRK